MGTRAKVELARLSRLWEERYRYNPTERRGILLAMEDWIMQDTMNARVERGLLDIEAELEAAVSKFPPFRSAHEGYAILLEEMDELKAEVWKNPAKRDPVKLRAEAVQVAAMALRFLVDVAY
jgi:hypothetical protein